MADVTFQRSDHEKALKDWSLVSDVCAGERQVKAQGKTYLPPLNPNDVSKKGEERYQGFLSRAVFYSVTGRTLEGLLGTVFRKDPSVKVSSGLDYIKQDIDGRGVSIYQQSQQVVRKVTMKGRHALFVDYPNTEVNASKAALKAGLIRATVISTDAENVVNWRSEKVGATYKLSLVVITEEYMVVTEDGFGTEKHKQYRVLKLNDGVYTVEIWRKEANSAEWKLHETYVPKTGKGTTWDTIPLVFVGATNNDTEIDKSPLLDLATLNLAHYRNSALYEDSVHYLGRPQPWMNGLNKEWRDFLQNNGIEIGTDTVLPLPENGQFGFAQVGANTQAKEAMDQKDEQMKALGARLLQKGQAVKTATEAQNENESEHSVLSLIAANVSEAYTQILTWMGVFNNDSSEVEFRLNQDFIEHQLDAQMLTALVAAWQAGRLPSSDYWDLMRKHGMVDPEKTDEDLEEEVETAGSGTIDLDDVEELKQ